MNDAEQNVVTKYSANTAKKKKKTRTDVVRAVVVRDAVLEFPGLEIGVHGGDLQITLFVQVEL